MIASVVLSNMEMEVFERQSEEEEAGGNKRRDDVQIEDGEEGGRKENNESAPCLNHDCVVGDDDDVNKDEIIVDSQCFGRRYHFADLSHFYRNPFSTCRQRTAQHSTTQVVLSMVVAFCCFGANIMVIGFIISLSIYYIEMKLAFPNDLKYVTLAVFLPTGVFGCVGVISGYVVSKFGIRLALVTGSLLLSSGIIVCCFVPTVPYILTFLGIMSGSGCSLIYISMNTALAHHFPDIGRILISLITLGESFGLIIFPTFVSYLVDKYSWRGSFLVLGATVFHCLPFGLVFSTKREYINNRKQSDKEPNNKEDVSETKPASREPGQNAVSLPTSDSNYSCVLDSSGTCKEENHLQAEEIPDLSLEDKKSLLLFEAKQKIHSTTEISSKSYPEDLIKIPYIERTPPLYKHSSNQCSQNSLSINSINNNTEKSMPQTDISNTPKQSIVKKLQFIISNKHFVLYLCNLFIAFGNFNTVVTILPDFCYSIGLSVNQGAWIFSIGAIGDIISRFLGSLFLYMKFPSLMIFFFSIFTSSIVGFIYPFISSVPAITFVTFFYILTSGIAYAVYNIVVLDFFNLELYSLSMGLAETVSGLGVILSGFSIGLITEYNNNDYTICFYLVSTLNIVVMLPAFIYFVYNRRKMPVDTQHQS